MGTFTNHTIVNQRHLVAIDAENMVGGPTSTPECAEALLRELDKSCPGIEGAMKVVSMSHCAARKFGFMFAGLRQIWRSGKDGADLALIGVLKSEDVENRFTHVTICSGDWIFADVASRLSSLGIRVTVIVGRGRLAPQLALAADEVIYLDDESFAYNFGEVA